MPVPRLYRRDFGKLGEAERTPQGGYKIPAAATRAGVFVYHGDDGKEIREWRPDDEVFADRTLASLKAATLTLRHPPAGVDTVNFATVAQGHIGDDVRRDGDKTAATVYAQRAEIVSAIDAGWRELSCGYHCDVDETPGTVPAGEPDAGKPYDRVQRGILYNHVALVQNGRAGATVRLRLDASGNSFEEPMEKEFEVIGGVRHEVGTDAHRDARARLDGEIAKGRESFALLTRQRDDAVKVATAEKKRADEATAKHVKLVGEVKEAFTPERLDAAVRNRTAVVTKAIEVLGATWKADGKTNAAIKREVLARVRPGLHLDDAEIPAAWKMVASEKPVAENVRRDARGNVIPALPAHLVDPPTEPGARADGKKLSVVEEFRADSMDDQPWMRPPAVSGGGTTIGASQAAQAEQMR